MRSEPRAGAAFVRTCVVCRKRYSRERMFVLSVDAPGDLGTDGAEIRRLRPRRSAYVCDQPSCGADPGLAARASHALGRAVGAHELALVALSPAVPQGRAGGGEVLEQDQSPRTRA